MLLLLACAGGIESVRPEAAAELEEVGTFVEDPSGESDGDLPGAFLPLEWESLVLEWESLVWAAENHHLIPMYLGRPPNGQTYRLSTAYHKAITQAFRGKWAYGQGRRPDPQKLQDIMIEVYAQYPIPQLIGIEP
ncbi:hypothetical protein ACLESO_01545 [Pyxidicoccus sp. 3LG]